jgi:hypothetical protein
LTGDGFIYLSRLLTLLVELRGIESPTLWLPGIFLECGRSISITYGKRGADFLPDFAPYLHPFAGFSKAYDLLMDDLSETAKEIFRYHVEREGCNNSAGRAAVVLTALEALDPLTQIREELDKEGLFVKGGRSGLTRLNPLVRIEERQLKLLAIRLKDKKRPCNPSIVRSEGKTSR